MNSIQYNIHNNMLIIGKASTNHGLMEVMYWDNPDAVNEYYGENSSLAKAFNEAHDMGVENIFLINIQKKYDYLEIADLIKQNDFAYIVLTDMYITDTFNDPAEPGVIHNYMAYILGIIGLDNNSVFFVTDKHASLFEDIDSFNDYMNNAVSDFKDRCSGRANLENIVVVGNNLEDHELANVTLCSAICTTPINQYPSSEDFGKPIFSIDPSDRPKDYVYFAPQTFIRTTVENLLNCLKKGPRKVFPVSRIVKYIDRGLDLTEFKGRPYSAYIKMRIEKRLDNFLKSMVGSVITDYSIQSVVAYRDVPGTVVVTCNFSILPPFSFEFCQIEKEIAI